MAASACPSDDVLAKFVARELDESERATVEQHTDACDRCREAVALCVAAFGEAPREDPAPLPRPGVRLGRYRILESIGAGSMGAVYSAFDGKLRRQVAIKVLPPGVGDEEAAARMFREAQALARLSHPNVVAVYDVDTWDGRVFVAMELVAGTNLRSWLTAQPRSWEEIRAVFVAAGRGLQAAHRQDLVHRDFKPDNVLIGEDGRVCVTDFGLARVIRGETTGPVDDADNAVASGERVDGNPLPPDVVLTRTGALMGTPAYMAPEQHLGRTADAASDQFAFCVALYEAIHGVRPFAGETLAAIATNVVAGRVRQSASPRPDARTVPRRVRAAILRGLSAQPRDRFPSMSSLLAVIERDMVRRWSLIGAAATSVLGVASMVWALGDLRAAKGSDCPRGAGLGDVWNESRRVGFSRAFAATELPLAAESAERFIGAIDDYAAEWEDIRVRSCEDEDQQAIGVLAVRQERCLQLRRAALVALLDAYDERLAAQLDADELMRAGDAVESLPPLHSCEDRDSLLRESLPPAPRESESEVEAVRTGLATVDGEIAAGRYAVGLELARNLDERAAALAYRPLEAETRLKLATLLDLSGDALAAADAFEEASLLATASRHHFVAARALTMQVYVLGSSLQRFEEARRVAKRAEAAAEAAEADDAFRAGLLINRAVVAIGEDGPELGLELTQQAIDLLDPDRDAKVYRNALFNLAICRNRLGYEKEAEAAFDEYIAHVEASHGPHHPELASAYYQLGVLLYQQVKTDRAREAATRAWEIARTFDSSSLVVAGTLELLGSLEASAGNGRAAEEHYRNAIAAHRAQDRVPAAAVSETHLAVVLIRQGRVAEGEALAQQAAETLERFGDRYIGAAYFALIEAAAARGDAEAVRTYSDRELEVDAIAAKGPDDPDWMESVYYRVLMLCRAGAADEALEEHARFTSSHPAEPVEARTAYHHFELAQCLIDAPGRESDALDHAREALRVTTAIGDTSEAEAIESWIARHGTPSATE